MLHSSSTIRRRARGRHLINGAVVTLMLGVSVGCSANASPAAGPRPGDGPLPDAATAGCGGVKLTCGTLAASDNGVTASTIRIGFLAPSVSALSDGGVDAGIAANEKHIVTAWSNELNRLGLNGRKVDVVTRSFDVVDLQDQQAACKALTQDEKVFSVLTPGGFDSVAQLCIAQQNATPLISTDPEPASWYQQAAPYLFSTFMSKDRIMVNTARWLKDSGVVKPGDKVGLVYHDIPTTAPSVTSTYLPALKAQGLEPVKVVKLAADGGTGLGQIGSAVNEFKKAGVTVVIPVMNLVYKAQFQKIASQQQYRPRYIESDINFGCADFTTTAYDRSGGFDHTQCLTSTEASQYLQLGTSPTAWTRYADEVYSRTFPDGYANAGTDIEAQRAQTALNYSIGTLFMLWYQAADRAGTNLTRTLFGQSMQLTGPFDRQVGMCGLSFGKGKFDGADGLSVAEFSAAATAGARANSFHTSTPCFAQYQ